MEIILLKDVEKLGPKGAVTTVADGYARNFLLPRKLAEVATPGRVAAIRKAVDEKEAKERREAERAEEVRDLLARTVVTVAAAAGTGEKIFGSVTNAGHRRRHLHRAQDPHRQAQGDARRAHHAAWAPISSRSTSTTAWNRPM